MLIQYVLSDFKRPLLNDTIPPYICFSASVSCNTEKLQYLVVCEIEYEIYSHRNSTLTLCYLRVTYVLQKAGLQHYLLFSHGPDLCYSAQFDHSLANAFEAMLGKFSQLRVVPLNKWTDIIFNGKVLRQATYVYNELSEVHDSAVAIRTSRMDLFRQKIYCLSKFFVR